MENKTPEDVKPDFEEFKSALDQYISANIGVSINSHNQTLMDKGECKYMLIQMYKDYIDPLQSELTKLREENENLKSVMIAAAEEIQAHWQTHCDEEGYGPANLMHRLEKGIPAQYAYKAGDFERLREENERLKSCLDSEVQVKQIFINENYKLTAQQSKAKELLSKSKKGFSTEMKIWLEIEKFLNDNP